MNKYERLLKLLLWASGVMMLLAVPMLLLSRSWMDSFSQRAGLGAFGDAALPELLARMVTAMYAMLGALTLVFARDVRRYRAPIFCLAVSMVLYAGVLTAAILATNGPWYWVLSDPLFGAMFGLAALWLLRRSNRGSD